MPTTKPRLNLTLEREQYEVLQKLAQYNSRSMSAHISEVIAAVFPYWKGAVGLMEAYQSLILDQQGELARVAEELTEEQRAVLIRCCQALGVQIVMDPGGPPAGRPVVDPHGAPVL